MSDEIRIAPQPGPQEMFLSSSADIAIMGGAAGSGKTYGLLMEALRYIGQPGLGVVIFRRTYPEIMNEGGLWDTASDFYARLGGRAVSSPDPEFRFPSGARISLRHMQHEKNRFDWQGSQLPILMWDELGQFTWQQFSYMLSRNRSGSVGGIRPYIRGTCNPDPDHWLRSFLSWWIGPDGYPLFERSGKLRWMTVIADETHWADTREELIERFGHDTEPLSVTFIPGRLEDNKILEARDPGYRAKLKALTRHERERLLGGNWDARPVRGDFFQRGWFEVVEAAPICTHWVRYWDRAATEPSPANPDPDWTVGALVGKTSDKRTVIADVVRLRGTPMRVESTIKNTASQDGTETKIGLEQEPGASGKSEAQYLVRQLGGYNVKPRPKRTRKEQDWAPLSAQAQAGNVLVVRGPWNDAFFNELESLPDGHDDQADAASGAFNMLFSTVANQGFYDFTQQELREQPAEPVQRNVWAQIAEARHGA